MKRNLLFFLIVLLNVCTLKAQTGQIHILSVNDMHAAVERFPQFAAVVDSLRSLYPDMLLISAGDNRTGNPINDTHPISCKPMVDLMNKVGFNYSAIGNHEFDGGPYGLHTVINNSNFKYLCANMYAPDSLRLHIEPCTFIERNGIRIGILGLVQIGESTGHPDAHPKYFDLFSFRNPKEVAREYAWMRKVSNVFILLTHCGIDEDITMADIMPEADLIIGGHSHTVLEPCQVENGVMILQSGRDLKNATFTILTVKDGKVVDRQAKLIDVRNYSHSKTEVQALVNELSDNPELMRVITTAATPFNEKEELGCMMADALRAETDCDIALQNSGGVRYETKEKGDFTVNDVYRLDPFGNEVMVFTLSGEEVERLLCAASDADEYGPAYVAGIKYTIHLDKNLKAKSVKITNLDGSKFDKKRTYRVALSSYVASISQYEKEDEGVNTFQLSSDLLMEYLSKQTSVNYMGIKRVDARLDK